MALLFSSAMDPEDWWTAELTRRVDGLKVRVWPDVGDVADIEFALVWQPQSGDLKRYPNLQAIFSLGAGVDHRLSAGVDHLLGDPSQLPPGVPIARVVDPLLTAGMTEFVLLHVLRYHRSWPEYMAQAVDHVWRAHRQYAANDRTIGIMGLGVLGRAAADALIGLGFTVVGWSRSPKTLAGLRTFHGDDGLAPFLGRAQILICMLPLTPATAGILDAGTFAALPEVRGADQCCPWRPPGRGGPDPGPRLRPPIGRGAGRIPHRAATAGASVLGPSGDHRDAPRRDPVRPAQRRRPGGRQHPPRPCRRAAGQRRRPGRRLLNANGNGYTTSLTIAAQARALRPTTRAMPSKSVALYAAPGG